MGAANRLYNGARQQAKADLGWSWGEPHFNLANVGNGNRKAIIPPAPFEGPFLCPTLP